MKFLDITKGWKTYTAVAVAIGLGLANYFGYVEPHWVDLILAASGLGALRASIGVQTSKSAADLVPLVQEVLAQVTVPTSTPAGPVNK